jgi:hypothetical protein
MKACIVNFNIALKFTMHAFIIFIKDFHLLTAFYQSQAINTLCCLTILLQQQQLLSYKHYVVPCDVWEEE